MIHNTKLNIHLMCDLAAGLNQQYTKSNQIEANKLNSSQAVKPSNELKRNPIKPENAFSNSVGKMFNCFPSLSRLSGIVLLKRFYSLQKWERSNLYHQRDHKNEIERSQGFQVLFGLPHTPNATNSRPDIEAILCQPSCTCSTWQHGPHISTKTSTVPPTKTTAAKLINKTRDKFK